MYCVNKPDPILLCTCFDNALQIPRPFYIIVMLVLRDHMQLQRINSFYDQTICFLDQRVYTIEHHEGHNYITI